MGRNCDCRYSKTGMLVSKCQRCSSVGSACSGTMPEKQTSVAQSCGVQATPDEEDYLDDDYFDDGLCNTCGGDGFVDSVAQETGRWGWDDDEPGTCPNCNGSGKAEDMWYW